MSFHQSVILIPRNLVQTNAVGFEPTLIPYTHYGRPCKAFHVTRFTVHASNTTQPAHNLLQ